jgi:hypothetical protein
MDSNTYTTGEMIDLISKDNELIFEAVSGMYDGNIVAYNNDLGWLMWKVDNTYEMIGVNGEFINTKWKLLEMIYVLNIECPLVKCGKSYSIY